MHTSPPSRYRMKLGVGIEGEGQWILSVLSVWCSLNFPDQRKKLTPKPEVSLNLQVRIKRLQVTRLVTPKVKNPHIITLLYLS